MYYQDLVAGKVVFGKHFLCETATADEFWFFKMALVFLGREILVLKADLSRLMMFQTFQNNGGQSSRMAFEMVQTF